MSRVDLGAGHEEKCTAVPKPTLHTDVSARLREYAGNPGYSHNDYADTMRAAADEIERYYGGMMAWKQTAETKDAKLSAEISARIDERIAGRLAAQPVQQAVALTDERIIEVRDRIWDDNADDQYDRADIEFARAILAAAQGGTQ